MVHFFGEDLHDDLFSSSAVSTRSSSCTCRISLERRFSLLNRSSTRIIAILMMSAAVPLDRGVHGYVLRKERCMKFEDFNSGTGRRRPNIVVTYPAPSRGQQGCRGRFYLRICLKIASDVIHGLFLEMLRSSLSPKALIPYTIPKFTASRCVAVTV